MNRKLVDTVLLGIGVWAIGYAMGFYIITIPGYPQVMDEPSMLLVMGAMISLVTGGIAYLRFRNRSGVTWNYALLVGISWLAVAIFFDYLFIVLLFNASQYYRLHILLYYALTLVVPTLIVRAVTKSDTVSTETETKREHVNI